MTYWTQKILRTIVSWSVRRKEIMNMVEYQQRINFRLRTWKCWLPNYGNRLSGKPSIPGMILISYHLLYTLSLPLSGCGRVEDEMRRPLQRIGILTERMQEPGKTDRHVLLLPGRSLSFKPRP